jgi:NAD-dependent DNA ligase
VDVDRSKGSEKNFSSNPRNRELAIYGLKGILKGMVADKSLNEKELFFLDVWLQSKEFLKEDGDVVDLLDLIGGIIEDGVVTSSELLELNELINDVIQYKEAVIVSCDGQLHELTGLLTGIISDSVIKDSEVEALSDWLSKNSEIKDIWPANIIISRLEVMLEDGVFTEEEKTDLFSIIQKIIGLEFESLSILSGIVIEFFESPIQYIAHEGSCFCFSGEFVSGSRKAIESSAHRKGATTQAMVSASVQYLVIGTLSDREWIFSDHGKEIQSALALNKDGHHINIITERTWTKYK